jgi:hypothetical protein
MSRILAWRSRVAPDARWRRARGRGGGAGRLAHGGSGVHGCGAGRERDVYVVTGVHDVIRRRNPRRDSSFGEEEICVRARAGARGASAARAGVRSETPGWFAGRPEAGGEQRGPRRVAERLLTETVEVGKGVKADREGGVGQRASALAQRQRGGAWCGSARASKVSGPWTTGSFFACASPCPSSIRISYPAASIRQPSKRIRDADEAPLATCAVGSARTLVSASPLRSTSRLASCAMKMPRWEWAVR